MAIDFFAAGTPAGQGSMTAFKTKHGSVIMQHSNKKALLPWREAVACAALRRGAEITSDPVEVVLEFRLRRPESHYRANGEVKPSAPKVPSGRKNDIDKLCRAVLDALTNVAWVDDGQVVQLTAMKVYVERLGATGVAASVSRRAYD